MMRLKHIVFFLTVYCCTDLGAQNVYFKQRFEYQQDDAALNMGLLVCRDSSYLLYGAMETQTSNDRQAAFIRLDKSGIQIDTLIFGFANHLIEIKSLLDVGSGLIGVGHIRNLSGGKRDVYLARINNHLDTIWTKRIAFGTDTLPFVSHAIMCSDSTIALCGMVNNDANTDQNILFLRLDTLGNVLNFKSIGWTNSYDYCETTMDQTRDGGFIIGGGSEYLHPLGPGYFMQVAFKLDALGNLQWYHQIGRNDAQNGSMLVKSVSDSTIILYSAMPQAFGLGGPYKWYLKKINYQNQTVWYKEYPEIEYFPGIGPLIELEDSSLVMMRTINQPSRTRIVKFDKDGNYLWNRFVPYGYGNHAAAYVGHVPSDGGFAFSGFYQPNFPMGETGTQDLYIVKTNCLGFDAPPQVSAQFLNPGNFQVLLENNSTHFGQTLINWGDGQSNLYGENDDTLIYHTYPGAGTYSISISAIACGDTATLTQNFTATLTGISEQQEQTFKIWPNPAESLLNIQLSANETGCEIALTDVSGKVIVRQHVPSGIDYSMMDIQYLARGIYFVRLQPASGDPITVKVVKQ